MTVKPGDVILHNGEPRTVAGVSVYRALSVEEGRETARWGPSLLEDTCRGRHAMLRRGQHMLGLRGQRRASLRIIRSPKALAGFSSMRSVADWPSKLL